MEAEKTECLADVHVTVLRVATGQPAQRQGTKGRREGNPEPPHDGNNLKKGKLSNRNIQNLGGKEAEDKQGELSLLGTLAPMDSQFVQNRQELQNAQLEQQCCLLAET